MWYRGEGSFSGYSMRILYVFNGLRLGSVEWNATGS